MLAYVVVRCTSSGCS